MLLLKTKGHRKKRRQSGFLTRFLGELAESCNPVWWSTAENPQWKWEERAGSIDPEHRLRSNRGLWDSLWKVNGRGVRFLEYFEADVELKRSEITPKKAQLWGL